MPDGLESLRKILAVDRTVHEPARLVILTLLALVDQADFVFLQDRTGLSVGNLSSHLGKLEAAGFVDVEKGFRGKRPQTTLRLTPEGREALKTHLETLAPLLDPPRPR
jgi:DNA-binding MarR family transcriptional regulator